MNIEQSQASAGAHLPEVFSQTADWKQHLAHEVGTARDAAAMDAAAHPNDEKLGKMAELRSENARLMDTVVDRAQELGVDEGDMQKTSALLNILHKASPKTFSHVLRVSLGAATVADHMKADTEFADDEYFARDVFLAALNHDAGKAESKVDGEWLLDASGERVVPDSLTLTAYQLHCTDENIGDWTDRSPGSLIDQFKRHSEAGKRIVDFVGLPNFVGDVAGTHHVLQFSPAGMIDHYESLDDRTKLMVATVTLADGQDGRLGRNDRDRDLQATPSGTDSIMRKAAAANELREKKINFVRESAAHVLRVTGIGEDLPDAELGDEVDTIVNAVEVGRRGEPPTRAVHPVNVGPRDIEFLDGIAARQAPTDRFAPTNPANPRFTGAPTRVGK